MLVTTAMIESTTLPKSQRYWNEQQTSWKLHPTNLVIEVASCIPSIEIRNVMQAKALPLPTKWQMLSSTTVTQQYKVAFSDPGNAATVLEVLDGYRFYVHGGYASMNINYASWNTAEATYHIIASEIGLPILQAQDQNGSTEQNGISNYLHVPTTRSRGKNLSLDELFKDSGMRDTHVHGRNQTHPADGQLSTELLEGRRQSKVNQRRSMSRGRQSSEGDGYTSGASHASSKRSHSVYRSDLEPDPDVTPGPITFGYYNTRGKQLDNPDPKRQKLRLPKVKAGYKCRQPKCDKVFDYNGERTKHERIHWPESEYPYMCQYCDKRFINKKDATRHERVHLRKWLPSK